MVSGSKVSQGWLTSEVNTEDLRPGVFIDFIKK